MPDLKVAQNTARRELLALKQLPTKNMTASQQKIWERLVNPDSKGNRLIDIYYDKLAEYERDHLRNTAIYSKMKEKAKNISGGKYEDPTVFKDIVLPYFSMFYPGVEEAFIEDEGRQPITLNEFRHYFQTVFSHKYPKKRDEICKLNEIKVQKVIPPQLKAHVDEYLKNRAEGKINILKDMNQVRASQDNAGKDKLLATKAKTDKRLTDREIEGILYGTTIDVNDNHIIKANAIKYGKGLMNLMLNEFDDQNEENYKDIQNKRFELMKKEIEGFTNKQKIQIIQDLINEEYGEDSFGEDFEHLYDQEQLREYMSNLKKNESFNIKIPKVKSLTESFYELLGQRLDGNLLKEDDSPADFATGLNNAVTSQSGVDMSTSDTSSTSSDTNTTSTSSSPDFDYTLDTGDTLEGGFGGISGPNMLPNDVPDDDTSNVPTGEYKVLDILVNDKDTSKVKLKIQDTKTKETEIVDLGEVDV